MTFTRGEPYLGFPRYLFFWRCTISTNSKDLLTNEKINAAQVRLIGPSGEQLGIVSSTSALQTAYDKNLDLVMIAPTAQPPVCKIMDYGKYRFECDKREKEAKKKQQIIETKEIQLTCNIGEHDIQTKLTAARRFLTSGNKVRTIVKFKGREMRHTEIGYTLLDRFISECSELGQCDKAPVLEGRNLTAIILPIKK